MIAMIEHQQRGKDLHHASAGRHAPAGACAASRSMSSRRMRRAVRPFRRRQIVDPEDDLRQLSLRRRPDRHPSSRASRIDIATRRTAADPQRAPAHASAMSASSCARCRGSATIDVVAEPLIANGAARGDARDRPRCCCAGSMFPRGSGRCRRRPSPAASSSASTSRAASSPTSRSCCSTSRPPRSTPSIARVVEELIDEKKRGRRRHGRHRARRRRFAT